jgi:hypothetical protein
VVLILIAYFIGAIKIKFFFVFFFFFFSHYRSQYLRSSDKTWPIIISGLALASLALHSSTFKRALIKSEGTNVLLFLFVPSIESRVFFSRCHYIFCSLYRYNSRH